MSEDYYELLGVDSDATTEEILRSYREQAAKHHPDVSDSGDAEGTFRRLNRAKAVLTDEDRRREYDRLGHERFVDRSEGQGRRTDAESAPGSEPSRPTRPFGSDQSGRGGSLFEPLVARTDRAAGSSVRIDPWTGVYVDLASRIRAAEGGSTVGDNDREDECPKCHGRGGFVHLIDTGRGRRRRVEPCERCGGAGTVAG